MNQNAREQRNDERRRRILETARLRADADGWSAVTMRHLAGAIGFTQPVLYGHFPGGKSEIMRAAALDGFVELTARFSEASGQPDRRSALEAVATAYLEFGSEHPAVYEAMFQHAIDVQFASDDTVAELRAGFDALADALGNDERGTTTELFWGALHGIMLLEHAGRMRPEQRAARVSELARRFS